MESELDIIDSLKAINYKGVCLQNDLLTKAIENGIRCNEFRDLVVWLTHELHILRKTDEKVSTELTDASEFAMELSAMLKELGCPYTQFVAGPLSERFESRESLMHLLEYLITELMTTKMCIRLKPQENQLVIAKFETDTARALQQLCQDLELGKPPENVTPKALFDKLNFKVEEKIRKVKPGILAEPLFNPQKQLTDGQWKKLEDIHADIEKEYNLRRQMLLTRLECTIQSFQWSDKMKNRENEIVSCYQPKMKEIELYRYGGDDTTIVALLAARTDLAIIEKTSSANVRKNTASKIQKHVIGSVPDRGGRAYEHAPPPPEMPSWQQQRASGPVGGRGGGRGGGGNFRGGRGGGGGGSGGGNWQQYSAPTQQRQPNYEQGRDQNWVTGSGRVQGSGWAQKANDYERQYSGNNGRGDDNRHYSGPGGGNYNSEGGNYNTPTGGNYNSSGVGNYNNRGGGSRDNDNRNGNDRGDKKPYNRGRSNYHRGR